MRATLGRRALALAIDWAASTFIAVLFTGSIWDPRTNEWNVFIFFGQVTLFTTLLQGSFGQLLTGIRIHRLDGGRPGLLAVALRTVLICLVLPAVFTGADGRGFHDRAAGTEPVRL